MFSLKLIIAFTTLLSCITSCPCLPPQEVCYSRTSCHAPSKKAVGLFISCALSVFLKQRYCPISLSLRKALCWKAGALHTLWQKAQLFVLLRSTATSIWFGVHYLTEITFLKHLGNSKVLLLSVRWRPLAYSWIAMRWHELRVKYTHVRQFQ